MPAPEIVANDIVIGVLKGTVVGQSVQNTFHWRVTNTVEGYNLSNLAQDMIDEMLPEYRLLLSEDWTAVSAYTRRITPNATRGIEIFTANDAGLVVSPTLPPQVSVVCSRLTNAPGPQGRGRIFLPAVPTSFVTDGRLTNLGQTSLEAFLPWLDLDWTPDGGPTLTPILFRRPNVVTPIETALARSISRSQRRREIGVGI